MASDADSEGWALDSRIARDTSPVGDLPLCRVLLMNDARYPWVLLLPRRARAVELFDLGAADRAALTDEIMLASRALKALTACDKINVAAIGNVVPQLHVHVVARFRTDAAWPKPVWGIGDALPYAPGAADTLAAVLRGRLPMAPGT